MRKLATAIAVTALLLAGCGGQDSGVEACEQLASDTASNNDDLTKEQYQANRAMFAESDDAQLRQHGTRMMDLSWEIAQMVETEDSDPGPSQAELAELAGLESELSDIESELIDLEAELDNPDLSTDEFLAVSDEIEVLWGEMDTITARIDDLAWEQDLSEVGDTMGEAFGALALAGPLLEAYGGVIEACAAHDVHVPLFQPEN